MKTEDRHDYESDQGRAAWWSKDGMWHVALPEKGLAGGFYWQDEAFHTKQEAIDFINK